MSNRRIFYACQAVGIGGDGVTFGSANFREIRGLQSVGINTTFNLEQVFEIGMISIYENIENIPDVEVTLEKVLDGFPLIYHLATSDGSTSSTLVGRSNAKAGLALSITDDTQEAASGTPITTCFISGCFVSQVSYKVAVDGNATESVTLVANNKTWSTGTTWTADFRPADNTEPYWDADPYVDAAPANQVASGIARRQHVNMATSLFPKCIPGINASGLNTIDPDLKCYNASFQSFSTSANLGREQILELGRKAPYFRYVKFPVAVTCELAIITKNGDQIGATEEGTLGNGNNLSNEIIKLVLTEGTVIDLGAKNKLQSANYQGGGTDGGNATVTYSFQTFNDFDVKHSQDPNSSLRPA
jgi:hypothetical protein